MLWANFLHFYQPPTQKRVWVDRITTEAYRPVLKGLLDHPSARITFNINGVLLDLWEEFGHKDVIEMVGQLLDKKQIELTGSAKYHPLLPKIPEDEIKRQIELNALTIKKYFGEYQPQGFFPPEMAYDAVVAKAAKEMGFSWIIAEELSCPGKVQYDRIYQEQETGVTLFFRERETSYKILSGQLGTGKLFLDVLGDRLQKNEYLLTGMDGETFGHHRPGMDRALMELLSLESVPTVLISELPEKFPQVERVEPRPSTWALMEKDLEKKVPFARWDDPDNEIHKMQWELTELAIKAVRDSKDPGKAREMLDRAIHSDQFWWASARPWWSLEMIERGAFELKEAVLATPDAAEESKRKAQELYYSIITTGFAWQRSGKVEELAQSEDEELRMHTDASLPGLPKEEIKKMVSHLEEELKEVTGNREFERAALLRDRIKELERYL
ncbi:MAG: Alpha-galactosidase [candidate division WWE3 bacterium CSP1-7]|uniref:Alpha-galactosidase n=2 Tax=Katanobacteria TaxID=422282 RepID=A0A0T5ZWT8_UNCKA|nr:MAG: Alpha-galactosidase [candidate division WWE3 bacterium CSP1-7]